MKQWPYYHLQVVPRHRLFFLDNTATLRATVLVLMHPGTTSSWNFGPSLSASPLITTKADAPTVTSWRKATTKRPEDCTTAIPATPASSSSGEANGKVFLSLVLSKFTSSWKAEFSITGGSSLARAARIFPRRTNHSCQASGISSTAPAELLLVWSSLHWLFSIFPTKMIRSLLASCLKSTPRISWCKDLTQRSSPQPLIHRMRAFICNLFRRPFLNQETLYL